MDNDYWVCPECGYPNEIDPEECGNCQALRDDYWAGRGFNRRNDESTS